MYKYKMIAHSSIVVMDKSTIACGCRLNYGQPSDLGHVGDLNGRIMLEVALLFYVHEEYAFIAWVSI